MKPLIDKNGKNKWLIGILVVAVTILLPIVVKDPYLIHLFIMAFISGILGMTFSMFFSAGLITLGAAAFYGIGAYASALFVTKAGFSFWLALPCATLITAIIALGLGSVISRHPGVAFVVITMLFAHVVVETSGQFEFFGGWGGIVGIPRPHSIGPIDFSNRTACYYLILALFLFISIVFYTLYTSRIGKVWRVIKLSPRLAETLGINLYVYRVLAFVIASSAAGSVGSFYAHYFQTITPDSFGGWTSIFVQLYSVLGGLGYYIAGPAIGAVIMTFLPEFLRITEEVEPIITGFLLLFIILFLPGGILGLFQRSSWKSFFNVSNVFVEIREWLKRLNHSIK